MKLSSLLSSLVASALSLVALHGQTVSAVTFDGKGDSSVRVIFNVSSTFTDFRIRYRTSDCTDGMSNYLQTNNANPAFFVLYGMTAQLSGLAPSTLYHVCPEVRNGAGAWSSGVEGTFTTLARTTTTPTAPTTPSTTFPDLSSATVLNVHASDCANVTTGLQAQINAATSGRASTGKQYKIVVPKTLSCTGDYNTPISPDAITFATTDVRTSDSRLTLTGHPFSENDPIHFSTAGANPNCLPGNYIYPYPSALLFLSCAKGGGWNAADTYYVHYVDANHIQVLDAPSGSTVIPGYITVSVSAGADTITYLPTHDTPGGYSTPDGFGSVTANTIVQFRTTGALPGGISIDTNYYLLTACSASPNAACTTQISTMSGGTPVNLTCTGMECTGTLYIVDRGFGTMYVAPMPTQNTPWIVITTDGALPPEGVRTNSTDWPDTELFEIKKNSYDTVPSFGTGVLAHNYRFIGARFTGITNSDYLTSIDPRGVCIGWTTYQDSRFIVFDRVRVAGNTYPNRTGCRGGGLSEFWGGGYLSVINSDLRGLEYWHTWFGGAGGIYEGGGVGSHLFPTMASGSQVTITAGVAHIGKCTLTTSGTTTINFTGGTSSDDPIPYVDMNCNLQVIAGVGETGNCTTAGSISPGGGSPTCTFTAVTMGTPAIPDDGNGRRAGLQLAAIAMTSGSVDSAALPELACTNRTGRVGYTASCATEGANYLSCGDGPGPLLFQNNYISGSGLTFHCDEGAGPFISRHDYTVTQNTFDVPTSNMLIGPDSDGLWYGHRQPLEWKGGVRILVQGNDFLNEFSQDNPLGSSIIFTPIEGGYTTDVDVSYNQFTNVSGCTMYIGPTVGFTPFSRPGQRMRISNNLCIVDAWNRYVPTEGSANGVVIYGRQAIEDLTIDHNTFFNNSGISPQFIHLEYGPIGGAVITNNFYFFTGDVGIAMQGDGSLCNTLTDKSLMDACFTSGPGNPSYTFSGNVNVPSWANSQTQTLKIATATVTGAFTGLVSDCPSGANSCVPSQTTVDGNVNYINWMCGTTVAGCTSTTPNMQLNTGSTYHNAGTDMTDIGVNFPALEDALGRVGTVSISAIAPTTATVNIDAPSTFGCPVDYGTTMGLPTYTRATNAGGSTSQTVDLMGLSPTTVYYYRIDCASEQPTGSFTTVSGAPATTTKGNVKYAGPAVIR